MLKVVEKGDERKADEELLLLDEIAREGARRMLSEALRAEVDDYVERYRSERDEQGHALVVRNGHAQTRKVTLGAEQWSLARRGSMTAGVMNMVIASASQPYPPPYMRRSPKVAEVLPIL